MPFYGAKPEGTTYYAREDKFEFIVWGQPPEPGDKLCMGLTGRTENQLVRDILDGRYPRHYRPERQSRPNRWVELGRPRFSA